MLITLECSGCKAALETEAGDAGAQVACPACGTVFAVPRKGPGPGTTIGGFLITRLIGTGGMGKVYLATQLSMERDVALKVLDPHLTREAEDIERFLNEVRVSAKLDHPNIVTAYEAGDDDGYYFMAMAYIDGEPLDEKLKRDGGMEEKDALHITRKMASALAYAWNEHRMLHRDVKPENILLDRHGEPKLTDMGLSKTIAAVEQMTLAGTVIGTPNYMSPEQLEDLSSVDFRADMYSLGATLHHMLTGEVPFKNSTVVKTFQHMATDRLDDPRKVNPRIGKGCIDLLQVMLAKDPKDRYHNWATLLADLDRVQQGDRAGARRPDRNGSVLRRGIVKSPHGHTKQIHLDHDRLEEIQSRQREHTATSSAPQATTGRTSRIQSPSRAESRPPPAPIRKKDTAAIMAVAVAVVLVVGGLGGIWGYNTHQRAKRERAAAAARQQAHVHKMAQLQAQYSAALSHKSENPLDFDGTIRLLEKVRADAVGTDYDEDARLEIVRLQGEKARTIETIKAKIRRETQQLASAGELAAAINYLRTYTGPLVLETAELRDSLAAGYDRNVEESRAEATRREADRMAAARAALDDTIKGIAPDLLRMELGTASRRLGLVSEKTLEPVADEWEVVKGRITGVLRLREIVLESFRGDIGKSVTVNLESGPEVLLIESVEDETINAQKRVTGRASIARRFTIDDVSSAEMFKRLGNDQTIELDIMRGMLACQAKSYDSTRRYLTRAACPLAKMMVLGIDELAAAEATSEASRRRSVTDAAAARDYRAMLTALGLPSTIGDTDATIEAIQRKQWGTLSARRAGEQVDAFLGRHDRTDFAKEHAPVIAALRNPGGTSAARRPVMPFSRDALARALDRLKADNPNMAIDPKVDVQGKEIVMDLSGDPEIANIDGLAGLPIKSLKLGGTRIAQLGGLEGMPLQDLNLDGCFFVVDLTPLTGAPLRSLDLTNTGVADLGPLKGMPLESLTIAQAKVSDLSPLQGMLLTTLDAEKCGVITDLSPLAGMPLKVLILQSLSRLSDLSPLTGMPLEKLNIAYCAAVSDLSPLRDLPLTTLDISGCTVHDLSPLRDLPLVTLKMTRVPATDITPLKGITTLVTLTR